MESNIIDLAQPRSRVLPEDTVPPKVHYSQRQFTDKIWGAANVLFYLAYLITGFIIVSRSHARHVTQDDGTRVLNEYYQADAQTCCANNGGVGFVCDLLDSDRRRRLTSGGSKFDGDEGIFDAFSEAPEIIIGLLAIVIGVAVLWTVLLRFFAKPIVILVEVLKIAGVIYVGIIQEVTETRIMCFVGAALMIAYVIWQRKNILFAAKMISHSTVSLKENPSVLLGSLLIKGLYAGNAALFVLFFSKSFNVVEVVDLAEHYGRNSYYSYSYCTFAYPNYVQQIGIFWGLAYLWTLLLFSQMRLSVIATIVGSWHFHPEDKPGLFTAMKNIFTSFGTLSVSSLIATIAEEVNRRMNRSALYWISPTRCITWPLDCCMCIFGRAIQACIQMLTSYATVLHVFTGENFIGSARNSFKILSRHFEGGFVTDITSRALFTIASYAFSFCVALITWVWIDARFETGSFLNSYDNYMWILLFIIILFSLYYPVLGIYGMIIANKYLRDFERMKMIQAAEGSTDDVYDDDGFMIFFSNEPSNHIWIPPLAATFVGCIAMMFFTFMSGIFLDIVTTLFLCFAIDKDNNVDLDGTEFQALVKELPGGVYKEDKTDYSAQNDPEVPVAYAVQTH